MGRPTKIEPNPEHPFTRGGTDVFAQASVLDLYDPDRSQTVMGKGEIRPWSELALALTSAGAGQKGAGGGGLRILSGAVTSPTLGAQIQAPADGDAAGQVDPVRGDRRATTPAPAPGRPSASTSSRSYRLDQADVILSLDADFLDDGSRQAALRAGLRRAAPGRPGQPADEPALRRREPPTNTGSKADHRLSLKARDIPALARAIAAGLGVAGAAGQAPQAAAALRHRSRQGSAGASRPRAGRRRRCAAARRARAGARDERRARQRRHDGRLHADAAGQPRRRHRRAARAGRRDERRHRRGAGHPRRQPGLHGAGRSEVRGGDGQGAAHASISACIRDETADAQPVARPRDALSRDVERRPRRRRHRHGLPAADRAALRVPVGARDRRRARRRDQDAARDRPGLLEGQLGRPRRRRLRHADRSDRRRLRRASRSSGAARCTTASSPGTAFAPKPVALAAAAVAAAAGRAPSRPASRSRSAPIRRSTTAASPTTAGCRSCPSRSTRSAGTTSPTSARGPPSRSASASRKPVVYGVEVYIANLTVNGHNLQVPLWIMPGQPDGSIALHLGYGRTHAGRIGNGLGYNANFFRYSATPWVLQGASLAKTDQIYNVASTQGHFQMENRAPDPRRHPDAVPARPDLRAAHGARPQAGRDDVRAVEVRGPRLGHGHRPERLQRLQRLRRRLRRREQHPGRRQAAGDEGPRDALAAHRPLLGGQRRRAVGALPAGRLPAVRERALRGGLPGRRDRRTATKA